MLESSLIGLGLVLLFPMCFHFVATMLSSIFGNRTITCQPCGTDDPGYTCPQGNRGRRRAAFFARTAISRNRNHRVGYTRGLTIVEVNWGRGEDHYWYSLDQGREDPPPGYMWCICKLCYYTCPIWQRFCLKCLGNNNHLFQTQHYCECDCGGCTLSKNHQKPPDEDQAKRFTRFKNIAPLVRQGVFRLANIVVNPAIFILVFMVCLATPAPTESDFIIRDDSSFKGVEMWNGEPMLFFNIKFLRPLMAYLATLSVGGYTLFQTVTNYGNAAGAAAALNSADADVRAQKRNDHAVREQRAAGIIRSKIRADSHIYTVISSVTTEVRTPSADPPLTSPLIHSARAIYEIIRKFGQLEYTDQRERIPA